MEFILYLIIAIFIIIIVKCDDSNSNNITIIFIDGNIGSGKSTLIGQIKRYTDSKYNIEILPEPIDLWQNIKDENNNSLFSQYYECRDRWSFSFQHMVLISKCYLLKSTIDRILKNNKKTIIVIERSFLSDRNVFARMCFDNDWMNKMEWEIYLKWYDYLINELLCLDRRYRCYYFNLNTNVDNCFNNINTRNRIGETDKIPLKYLEEIKSRSYDLVSKSLNIIDGNKNYINDTENIKMRIEKIFEDIRESERIVEHLM